MRHKGLRCAMSVCPADLDNRNSKLLTNHTARLGTSSGLIFIYFYFSLDFKESVLNASEDFYFKPPQRIIIWKSVIANQ